MSAPEADLPEPLAPDALTAATLGQLPSWGRPVAHQLIATLLSGQNPFPCTFGVAAAKKNTLRFGFVDSAHDPGTWGPLTDILTSYLACYQELGKDTSLVVFFGPDEPEDQLLSQQEYFSRFWSVLQFLHEKDGSPWPEETPTDPDHPLWEFSFGGTEIFVVCNTPAHITRNSRHSPGFVITFQPRWVFEGLEPDSPRGIRARQVIRKRIRRYDALEPAPELGDFGNADNREWRQYFLPDAPGDTLPACPFHAVRNRTGAAPEEPQ
ncbi:YqcI/YcgG family protein [Streptomyces sp. NPDC091279]|uniref:YqcI/YcgG family protein n=1 Tax=unclassified Streptomyces TaxID=2593676 RepID=UPI00382B93B9